MKTSSFTFGSDCELGVLVEKRSVVRVNCRGCNMETMRSVEAIRGATLSRATNMPC